MDKILARSKKTLRTAPAPVVEATGATGARAGLPRVAVITVTYNSAAVLDDFLSSLAAQTSRDWALIVVDNASTDKTREMIETWQGPLHALVANRDNVGFGRGMNQCIEIAWAGGFDSVLMLNNDTLFGATFMADLLNSPHKADAPLLAPLIRYADDPERLWFAGGRFTWLRGGFQAVMVEKAPSDGREAWKTSFAPACCLLIGRAVFERVGMFDDRYFVYWEDVDFCWRCKALDIEIAVLRSPSILHKVSALTGGGNSPFSIRMWHTNQVAFIRKHFGNVVCLASAPAMFLKILVRLARGRDGFRETRLRWRATLDALFARTGNGADL